jgi:hypothetical protein
MMAKNLTYKTTASYKGAWVIAEGQLYILDTIIDDE